MLNTYSSSNVPIITNAAGREDRDFTFEFGVDTQVFCSCSLTWKNELYVFGGDSKRTQISKLLGCQLSSIGHLSFNHYAGGCANVADAKLYLCFNDRSVDYDTCRVATSPTGVFSEINRSHHAHRYTRIAASHS